MKDNDKMQLKDLENIIDKPMWFFHSRNDKVLDFEYTTKVVSELQSLGANNIQTTWFDEPLHDITSLVYDNQSVWTWLFSQRM